MFFFCQELSHMKTLDRLQALAYYNLTTFLRILEIEWFKKFDTLTISNKVKMIFYD